MSHRVSARPAPVAVSNFLDHRTKLYSAAALAAGVSMLALATPAEAEVVVTKANLPVTYLNSVFLDLNKDGIADFRFSIFLYADFSFFSLVNVAPLADGQVVTGLPGPYASALIRGAKIGPTAHFSAGSDSRSGVPIERIKGSSRGAVHAYGNWGGGTPPNRFLGVKFLMDGATHYGWVRLTVTINHSSPISATITGYAYETIPNKRILAGVSPTATNEPSALNQAEKPGRASLGMLALGADGLALWRREKTLTSN